MAERSTAKVQSAYIPRSTRSSTWMLSSQVALEALPFAAMCAYVCVCPYTKVEESFHLQAVHDILVHGGNVQEYDHVSFPGVVPRTFLGALVLSGLAWPVHACVRSLGLPRIFTQLAVRMLLGMLVVGAYVRLASAVRQLLGRRTAMCMLVAVSVCPHALFYASRTLPNTFATALVTHAFAEWVMLAAEQQRAGEHGRFATYWDVLWPSSLASTLAITHTRPRGDAAAGVTGSGDEEARAAARARMNRRLWRAVACLVCAIVWLRCDMLVLLFPVGLAWLLGRRAAIPQLVVMGATVGVLALAASVVVDSWFWRRWLWPEGEVLWFNTVKDGSRHYGVAPWHWYFTVALRKALLGVAVAVPAGLLTLNRKREPRVSKPARGGAAESAVSRPQSATEIRGASPARPPLHPRSSEAALAARDAANAAAEATALTRDNVMLSGGGLEEYFWERYQHLSVLQVLARVRIDMEIAEFLLPGIGFVCLYSLLPHKELRFIMPGFPLFYIAAGRGLAKLWKLGNALFFGLQWHRLGPEAAAAELVADAVETLVDTASPAVAALVGTPRAALRQRHQRFLDAQASRPQVTLSLGRLATMNAKAPPPLPALFRRPSATKGAAGTLTTPPPDVAPSASPLSHASDDSRGWSPFEDAVSVDSPTGLASHAQPSSHEAAPRAAPHVSPLRAGLGLLTLALVVAMLAASAVGTMVFVAASMYNYPGGAALQRLYTLYRSDLLTRAVATTAGDVHVSSATGVSSVSRRSVASSGNSDALPRSLDGQLLPCPDGDVTATGMFEYARMCLDMKGGCPASAPPSFPAGARVCYDPFTDARDGRRQVRIHIDVAAAEMGVSRFAQSASIAWVYNKSEHLTRGAEFSEFDYLLTENHTFHAARFDVVETIPIFARIRLPWSSADTSQYPPLASSPAAGVHGPGGAPVRVSADVPGPQGAPGGFWRRIVSRVLSGMHGQLIVTQPRIFIMRRRREDAPEPAAV